MPSFIEGLLIGQLLNTPGYVEDEFSYDSPTVKPTKFRGGKVRAYINIVQDAKDDRLYNILITPNKIKGAIESEGFRDMDGIDLAVEMYQAKYKALGRTFTEYML